MQAASQPDPNSKKDRAIFLAQETLDIEAAAILGLKARIGSGFGQIVEMILQVRGRVVVMGMGKSGHIGRKVAATLASTGTAAMFVHPAEASHGDLGMIKTVDLVLAISNSGESGELMAILPVLKRLGVPLIVMTGNLRSTLASYADLTLDSGVDKEACPSIWHQRPVQRPSWPWVTRSPSPFWTRAVSRLRILPVRTPAARWGASC